MRSVLMLSFFILTTLALLPSWAFAAVMWRRKHGLWVWVNPSEYARCAYIAQDWTLVFVNNVFWIIIFLAYKAINYFL